MFCDIKGEISTDEVKNILIDCVFNASPAGLEKEIERYLDCPELRLFGWVGDGCILGVVGFQIHESRLEICHIATHKSARRQGIGSQMISVLKEQYRLPIDAETDSDAVDFYVKCGFVPVSFQKYGVTRYLCTLK